MICRCRGRRNSIEPEVGKYAMASDPLVHRAHAEAIVRRAAEQLRDLLQSVVAEIDQFPPFSGSMFSYGIEVDLGVGGDSGGAGAERGCVVLAEDGELYELQIGFDVDQVKSGNPLSMRSEERIRLDDLSPAEYVGYAQRAVAVAVEYLLEQQTKAGAVTDEPNGAASGS